MKRAIGLSSFILFALISLFSITACKSKFDIEENNRLFFTDDKLYKDDSSIYALSIYYYESYFYYDVEVGNDTSNYHFLYIYRYKQFQIRYSIKHPETDLEYYPASYFKFLESKEKGKFKTYTKEEIDYLVNYYNGTSIKV